MLVTDDSVELFWEAGRALMAMSDAYDKEASAQATRLSSLTTTLAAEYARQGKDWEVELRQLAREQNLKKELGLKSGHELQYGNQSTHESERETGDE